MKRDSHDRPGLEAIDDAGIEQLVRDVVGGWSMPAVRLDAPSWRERVRSSRVRRLDAARGWLGRVGQAATAAVALTVAGALAAVVITRPPSLPGASSEPTTGPSGPAASAPSATPLPKLLLDGDPPSPSDVLVQLDGGDFAIAELATGSIGRPLTGAAFGSSLQRRADGTLLCLCVKVGNDVNGRPTEAEVSIDRFDAAGVLTSSVDVASISGEPDPRDGMLPERPAHLGFETAFSEGGRYGFIGWSARAHPVWRSGVIVVDLVDGREVSRLELPDATSGDGDTRRVVQAPRIAGSLGSGSLVLSREWYSWSPASSQGLAYQQEKDVFRTTFTAGRLTDPVPVDTAGCGERVLRAGATSDDRWWLACTRGTSGTVVVRRFDAANASLGDTPVAVGVTVDGDMTAPSPDGRTLFVWNPTGAVLSRIDLESGDRTEGAAAVAAADRGPLAALGDWLAPTVAAKTFLVGGVVVSPDGSRVYAAGIDASAPARDVIRGSAGIFVFDPVTLEAVDRWEPTADFVSLAVSPDGDFVYAAGLPRVDAAGTPRPDMQASITVFAADGSRRLIAGQLGSTLLMFFTPTLQ